MNNRSVVKTHTFAVRFQSEGTPRSTVKPHTFTAPFGNQTKGIK